MSDWLEYHPEPVILHSGGRSHWLVRGDLIFADEHLRKAVLDYWEKTLEHWLPPFTVIGIPRGGVPWAAALEDRLIKINGDLISSTPYKILVDDVVTTGASISDPTAHIRLAVVDRRYKAYNPMVSSWARIYLPLEEE